MSAIVSFLWIKNADVLRRYVSRAKSKVYVNNDAPSWAGLIGSPALLLPGVLTPDARAGIDADAAARAAVLIARVPDAAPIPDFAGRLRAAMHVVAALDRAHELDGIELVLLNEDVTAGCKAAALWAKTRNVPSVLISHSTILGRLYTVHREANADLTVVSGSRGAQPYRDMGVAEHRLSAIGNPAWDVYANLPRDDARKVLSTKYGFSANVPLVVFAPTWSAKFTAFCDADAYDSTLSAVVRAVATMTQRGQAVRLVVKDRQANQGKAPTVAALAASHGVSDRVTYATQDTEAWMAAADAVVSVDSNIAIEACLAGTPSVNLWTAMSWLNGPFFGAEDGVLDVTPAELADALTDIVGDPSIGAALARQAVAKRTEFAQNLGVATEAATQVAMQARRPVLAEGAPYVWESLSSPTKAIESQEAVSTYNHHPRVELLAMFTKPPSVVLDVGCAAGATGAELKRRFPAAVVTGVELNADAAAHARNYLDRVLGDSIETMDYAAAGFAPGSIDTVFFPDVLEHLYDPWHTLRRLKPFLTKDAQVLSSIPNVRNMWLMGELFGGKWDYTEEGLLDVTHIRFFTRKSVIELFEQTGYKILHWGANYDPRVPFANPQAEGSYNVETPRFTVKNLSKADMEEMRTIQFLVCARPV